jgi:hypothetical protein
MYLFNQAAGEYSYIKGNDTAAPLSRTADVAILLWSTAPKTNGELSPGQEQLKANMQGSNAPAVVRVVRP